MNFDSTQRAFIARLADELIPAGDGFPSASEAGVAGDGLDQVLLLRPDLKEPLLELLNKTARRSRGAVLADLQENDPAAFALLTELVPAAYFLNPAIRAKLGYAGQEPRPIDPTPDYEGLLQAVIDRGPIYRPTPD